MKIKKVTVKDIKKIKFAEIEPSENVIVLTGNNEQGKSSFIDAMMTVFKGKTSIPNMPLNRETGATTGNVEVEMDNGLILERKVTEKGSTITVKDENGRAVTSPQTFIDERMKLFSFDPAEFSEADDDQKLKLAKKITRMSIGSDVSEFQEIFDKYKSKSIIANLIKGEHSSIDIIDALINDRNGELYLWRRDLNRDIKTLELATNTSLVDLSKQIESVELEFSEIVKAIELADKYCNKLEKSKYCIHDVLAKVNSGSLPLILELNTKLSSNFPEILKYLVDFHQEIKEILDTKELKLKELKLEKDEFVKKIAEMKASQSAFLASQTSLSRLEKLKEDRNICENEMTSLAAAKERILQTKKLPIPGMECRDDGVYVNGLPFSQLSQSKRMMISILLAMKLNPEIRVMRIENGNMLDEDRFELLRHCAIENDFQIWIEIVGRDSKVGFLFEDGMIKG